MIFVTVGTTGFPFYRMNLVVKKILSGFTKKNNDVIIYQYGQTPIDFDNPDLKSYSFLRYSKMLEYMSKAKIIIAHAGPATIFQSLQFNKIPAILPRLKKYGEHVNDHQLNFYKYMLKKGLVYGISEINSHIDFKIKLQTHRKRAFSLPNIKLISHLNNYL